MDDFWYSFLVKHLFESINVYVKIEIRNKKCPVFYPKEQVTISTLFYPMINYWTYSHNFWGWPFHRMLVTSLLFSVLFFLSSFQEVHMALFIINWSRVHYIILISEKEIILLKINLNRLMVNEVLYKWIPINT